MFAMSLKANINLEFGLNARWSVPPFLRNVDALEGMPQILAITRNLALNLYRDAGFDNMAQAQRKCQFSIKHIASLFRMK